MILDGYHNIRIRGTEVRVYCQMDTSPARIFVDIDASSRWGGSNFEHVRPNNEVTITWTRAEISVSECMVFLNRWDRTFAVTTTGIGNHKSYVISMGWLDSNLFIGSVFELTFFNLLPVGLKE